RAGRTASSATRTTSPTDLSWPKWAPRYHRRVGADRPTDEDVQDALAARIREQVRTQIPGVVVTYDPATMRAKVQPTRMIKRFGGPPVLLPPIPAAPVLWQRFGGM